MGQHLTDKNGGDDIPSHNSRAVRNGAFFRPALVRTATFLTIIAIDYIM